MRMPTLPPWLAVIRDTAEKVFVEPVRVGRPRPNEWPTGLRPVMLLAAIAYVVAALLIISSGWLREHDTLVQHETDTWPSWSVTIMLWLLAITLSLALTAALHTHPVIGLTTFAFCVIPLLIQGVALEGWAAWVGRLSVLALVVFYFMRVRRRFIWFEFPVILGFICLALYAPIASMRFGVGTDLRAMVLMLMLGAVVVLAMPTMVMGGYAPAEIAVTLGEWLVNRIGGETAGSRWRPVVLAIALTVGLFILAFDLGRGLLLDEWDFRPGAWIASTVAVLLAAAVCWLMLRRNPGRPPSGPTAEVWIGFAYPLVIVWVAVFLPIVLSIFIGAVLHSLGNPALINLINAVNNTPYLVGTWRIGVTTLAAVLAFRSRRKGERVAPVLLICFATLAALSTIGSFTGNRFSLSWSLPTLVMVAVALCVVAVPVVAVRRGRVERQLWIALLALVISAMVGRREILSEPGALAAGVSGLVVLLFGLVWRALTDAEITRRSSRWFPMSTRVLFYGANAMLAALALAQLALTRQISPVLDVELYASLGETLVGAPLVLAAILLGTLSTLGLSPTREPVPADTLQIGAERRTENGDP